MKFILGQKIIDTFRKKINFLELLNFIKLSVLHGQESANSITILGDKDYSVEQITKEDITFVIGNIHCMTKVNYPYMLKDVFADEVYRFYNPIDTSKKYTVFDMGANHCYASLYFAEKDWCKNVFAFELIPQNIDYAKKNLALNDEYIKNKIILNEFGLGNTDDIVKGRYFTISDGGCSFNEEFLSTKNKKNMKNSYEVDCQIKQASRVLRQILEENNIDNDIIIKCDVEGAEYDIFEDLVQNYPEIFDKTVKIVGETHLGFDRFYNIVKPYGFKITWKKDGKKLCPFELSKDE